MAIFLNRTQLGGAFHDRVSYCKGFFNRVLVFDFCSNDGGVNPEENLPPTIGDIDVYVDSGVKTPIGLDWFISRAAPPYNDPENDLLGAIRFTNLDPYGTNTGDLIINELELYQVNTIITREQLLDPNFDLAHFGDPGSLNTDVYVFQVRDSVNGNWVD